MYPRQSESHISIMCILSHNHWHLISLFKLKRHWKARYGPQCIMMSGQCIQLMGTLFIFVLFPIIILIIIVNIQIASPHFAAFVLFCQAYTPCARIGNRHNTTNVHRAWLTDCTSQLQCKEKASTTVENKTTELISLRPAIIHKS